LFSSPVLQSMATSLQAIKRHQALLRKCTRCPDMTGPPVTGNPVVSPVMLIGQAPGPKEIEVQKPFAWTAGKTLFNWFGQIGLDEEQFRTRVYMAAVCRCFPGKTARVGDRLPSREEVANCGRWLQSELRLLQPKLILPVGKLAIQQFIPVAKLDEVVGALHTVSPGAQPVDVIPLPHPSGASTWHRTEPGKSLLQRALRRIRTHPAWQEISR
jgi:uracil-DNA glycosylase